MADDIIARIKEEGISNFVKLIIDAGNETKKTAKEVDNLNDKLDDSGKSSKSVSDLTKEVNRLEKELKQAKNQADKTFDPEKVKKLEKELEKTNKETGRLAGGMDSIKKAAIGAFTVTAIVQFTKILGQAAIEIDSTGAKLKKVFGDSTKVVENFAKSNAVSLGLTTNEYKKAAAAAGDLLIPIGFQRKEAAKLSNDLVSLSGALAAWSGGQYNASQVSEILTKALLGEREQLKSLGISITEADVSTRLLEKGQKNLTGTLLQQAKAQATLELITEKSRDAQRAFADDTKTLAEQQLELNASIREVRDGLATVLIPVIGDFFDLLLFGGTVVKALIEDVREFFGLGAEGQTIISGYSEEAEAAARKALEIQEEGLRLAKGRDVINQAEIDAIQDAVNLRQKELDRLLEIKKIKEEANKVTVQTNKELEKTPEKIKRVRQEYENLAMATETPLERFKAFYREVEAIAESANEKIANGQEISIDKTLSAYNRLIQASKDKAEKEAEIEKEKQALIFDSAITVANGITDIVSQAYATQLANLEAKNEQGLISDKEYDRQRREILTKQARADKAASIIQSLINTAVAVTKVIANPILAAIVGSLGAAQTAFIAAQPLPQYAEGTKFVERGKNKKGRDTIPAMLDEGERVIDAKTNKKYWDDLNAIHDGKLKPGFIAGLLENGIPIQYNYDFIQNKLSTPNPSIENFVKDKAKAEAIKGALTGINLNPLLNSNDQSRLYIGRKLDKINYTLKEQGIIKRRRNG